IAKLESSTDWSLAVAVARSFQGEGVQPWYVNRVVRQAERDARAHLQNPKQQNADWVRSVVAHNLK
ncbi:MAG: hypothetical protein AAFX99_07795, partial [Myxococcota bacterium]